MSLVDSIKSVQGAVTQAFDQLVSDVEADTPTTVDKITVSYSDGSSADFTPTSGEAEVKDLTDEVPASGEKSEQEHPQAPPLDTPPPGNSEQV